MTWSPTRRSLLRRAAAVAAATLGAAALPASQRLAAAATAGAATGTTATGAYPDHPIRLVVPFAPGGAVDIVGRLIARYMGDTLGQAVFVDNRSGAGGSIGTGYVARAKPDGYTLLLHTVSTAVMNGLLYRHLPFDPRKDFTPITEVAAAPTLIVINAQVPARTLKDFVALVKAHPGKYMFGSTGVGSSVHLDGQLFAIRMGLDMVHVPYRGEGDAIKDLVAGQTQMETGVASAFLPYIRNGQLRALCVNDAKRSHLLPDVPTAAQAGLPDYELPNWYALVGPRDLPEPIVQQLYRSVKDALEVSDVRQKLLDLGLNIVGSDPRAFATYWDQQEAFWQPIVKATGISLQE
jgi:tripartite-type tricarboxylate transporter receptor subunit TctC